MIRYQLNLNSKIAKKEPSIADLLIIVLNLSQGEWNVSFDIFKRIEIPWENDYFCYQWSEIGLFLNTVMRV